jgi:hypothetical protein
MTARWVGPGFIAAACSAAFVFASMKMRGCAPVGAGGAAAATPAITTENNNAPTTRRGANIVDA